jgi:hypothetical protein
MTRFVRHWLVFIAAHILFVGAALAVVSLN